MRRKKPIKAWMAAIIVASTLVAVISFDYMDYNHEVSYEFEMMNQIPPELFIGVRDVIFVNGTIAPYYQKYYENKYYDGWQLTGLYNPITNRIRVQVYDSTGREHSQDPIFTTLLHELGHHDFHFRLTSKQRNDFCKYSDWKYWDKEDCGEAYANYFTDQKWREIIETVK